MSGLQSFPSVTSRHLAVTTLVVGLCCTPAAFALSGGEGPQGRSDPVPPKVARCLAKPTGAQRGACFRRTFGRHIPRRVSRCLGSQRAHDGGGVECSGGSASPSAKREPSFVCSRGR